MNFIKHRSLAFGLMAQIERSEPLSRLSITDPTVEAAGSGRGRRITAERGSSPKFEFSRVMVVSF
jgi:hypothetical protein